MKISSIIGFCSLLLATMGCTKTVLDYGKTEKQSSDQALLKINYVSAYANNRSVYFKLNDQRVSGLLTWRTPFPGGGYNTGGSNTSDFLQVNPGNVKLSVVLPRKVDNGTDSLELYSTTLQIAAGKNYTVHITDTAATTKSLLTEENFTRPDTATTRYRFVNLMPNVPSVDVYYGTATAADQSTDSLLLSNVPYLQMSNEFKLRAGNSKTWKIRAAGAAKTSATVIASYLSASVVLNQRVYTAFACGYNGKTTAAQKPYVSFFLVR
ncbi:DUF4397 domain-containing protein [Mucilaginibacter sp. CSA2-8R]|uniref:DUF4397 domain-containing protein n=1 Tax=Mucilaginibacter sp. CSA2-8R TaxID=3141542 RepID=UPI00315C74D3